MNNQLDLLDRLIADWKAEREDLDARSMGIVGRVLVLAKVFEARAELVLKPFGIRYTELDVLATLRRSGAPYSLRPSELLESVLITSGSMTVCIDRLCAKKLVCRENHFEDRRGCMVRLTKKGKRIVDRAIRARFDEASDAISCLSKGEVHAIEDGLRHLLLQHDPRRGVDDSLRQMTET